jgi:hypothetical protein
VSFVDIQPVNVGPMEDPESALDAAMRVGQPA